MKRKILIASFLKPVNDIRSYSKIAQSLALNSSYSVYCIGYPTNIELRDNKIKLLPLSYFNKSGFGRLLARWQAFKLYVKVKPELIIVNSPDLLIITCLYKILFGSQIIYDIRENYFRNLWYQQNYSWGTRHFFALVIRSKEVILSPLFSHFILAEKVYEKQLNFIGNRFSVIENKSLIPNKTRNKQQLCTPCTYLISGTIAIEYGILEGLNFFSQASKKHPNSSLKIIGHCANSMLYKKLVKAANSNSNISLHISSNPVPHIEIEKAILSSDLGLLPYKENKSTEGKWPTKIFEYMANKLPIIIQKNETWDQYILNNGAGISIDFSAPEKLIPSDLFTKVFYPQPLPNDVYWTSEENMIKSIVTKCFNK